MFHQKISKRAKDSKLTLKFKSIQYLAIFIKTNENDSDKTILNDITLIGNYKKISRKSIPINNITPTINKTHCSVSNCWQSNE